MNVLKKIQSKEVELLMTLDYNNVLGRLKYILGSYNHEDDTLSLFADVLVKKDCLIWSVRDDASYKELKEATPEQSIAIYNELYTKTKHLTDIISGDKLIGPYASDIISFPSDEYIFFKEIPGGYKIIITGWGCKKSINSIEDSKEENVTSSPTNKIPQPEINITEEQNQTIEEDSLHNTPPIPSNVVQNHIETPSTNEEEIPAEYTAEWLRKNSSITGWLTFFLFTLFVGGILTLCNVYKSFDIYQSAYNNGIEYLCFGDFISGLITFLVAFITPFLFIKRSRKAVFYARFYILSVLILNTMSVIINADISCIRSIAWSIFWGIYLSVSKEVQKVIPKSYRKVNFFDYFLLFISILIPSILYVLGLNNL